MRHSGVTSISSVLEIDTLTSKSAMADLVGPFGLVRRSDAKGWMVFVLSDVRLECLDGSETGAKKHAISRRARAAREWLWGVMEKGDCHRLELFRLKNPSWVSALKIY